MRSVVLALTVAAALVALPAAAQTGSGSTGTGGTSATTGSGTGNTTGSGMGATSTPGQDTPPGAGALHGSSTTHEPLSGTAAPAGTTTGTTTGTATTGTSSLRQGTTGANTSTTAGGAEVQETRTNPDTASLAPGGGLTLTGTVVSWNDQELVIRTSTGIEHLVLQPTTTRPSTFTEGQVVTVDYNRTSQNGVMIAEQVRLGGTLAGTSTVDTESQLEQDVEEAAADLGEAADDAGAAISQLDDEAEEEIEEELGANLDDDSTIGDSPTADMDDDTADTTLGTTSTLDTALPATAGESPLIALLGVLALGAAAGLRRLF
jgi:hypothetical protein